MFYGCVDLRVIFQSNCCIKSFFFLTMISLALAKCLKLYIELFVGTVMNLILEKLKDLYMKGKPNILKP